MSEMIEYRGYFIEPQPSQLIGTNRWEICVEIHGSPTGVSSKSFYGETFVGPEDEALRRGVAFGKDVIDGKVQNCTIKDL
jgi:hypothetical protein